MLRLLLSLVLLLTTLEVAAYYPNAIVKFDNVKVKRRAVENYEDKFLEYISEFPEILKPADKKYKVDQACSFTIELDTNGNYLMDTIKVDKMGENISYNLKAIEFLRQNQIKLSKKDPEQPVTVEMKYYAF